MISLDNPLSKHTYGRALCWLNDCELAGDMYFTDPAQKFPIFWNQARREYRVVAHYPVLAEAGRPYLVDIKGEKFMMDAARILSYLADNKTHELYLSYVAAEVRGRLQPMRPSNNNQPWMFQYWHNKQVELGIFPSDPLYVHPFSRLTKDAILVRLLQGEEVAPYEDPDNLVGQFQNLEWEERDRLTLQEDIS